mgnify:FL=1
MLGSTSGGLIRFPCQPQGSSVVQQAPPSRGSSGGRLQPILNGLVCLCVPVVQCPRVHPAEPETESCAEGYSGSTGVTGWTFPSPKVPLGETGLV